MDTDDIPEQKSALRTLCQARRRLIEPEAATSMSGAVSERICSFIPALDMPHNAAPIIAAYWPLEGELDLRPALKVLAGHDLRLALPRVTGKGRPLDFHLWHSSDELIESNFKVMEPDSEKPRVDPTLLLVPLLAFDQECRRLGFGQGHYDRTLARLRAGKTPVMAIGVAFSMQEVPKVPTDDYDQTLDMVVTENDTIMLDPSV